MVPLLMAKQGQESSIKRVGGKDDIRRFLETLGFVPGAHVTVVAESSGGVIVVIKESRVAVSREMALKIMV